MPSKRSPRSSAPPRLPAEPADKAAFEALRRSQARYRALAETTSDFIWEMDASGKYTYCSPQMEALWGIKPQQMLGKTPFDAMPPAEVADAVRSFRELAQNPAPFRGVQSTAHDAAGRLIHLETSGVPFFADDGTLLGFRGISRDVTEQKRMEAEHQKLFATVREEKERLAALLASIRDEVWFVDSSRRLTLVNPAVIREFQLPEQALDAERVAQSYEVLRGDGSPRPVEEAPPLRALRGEVLDSVEEIVRTPASREWRYREVSASPVRDTAGEIVGSVSVVRDITGRKRAEERLARQTAVVAGIARIFREALTCETEEDLGRVCLAVAEEATQSAFGFLAEINEATGKLDDIAISDPDWDARQMQAASAHGRRPPAGFEIRGLVARILTHREAFFTNQPMADANSIGLPPGHPPLHAFLGVPLVVGDKTIGILALANRQGGYRPEDREAAETLAPAIVQALLRARAEQQLLNTTRRFQTILDHAPVAMYVKDREGRYVFGNRRLERFTGCPLETLLGKTDYDIAPREDADRWRENDLEVLQRGGIREFEETGTDVDGRPYVNLSLKFPLTDDAGTSVAICGLSTDITERKRTEAALLEADRRKDEFIAILSHELRNPLAPIRYALPALQKAALTDEARTAIEVIDRQVSHLTRLVDDLLDISRITTSRIELRRDYVTLRTVVKAAMEAAAQAVATGAHSLKVDIPDEPLWVHADTARLSQVVTNLLDNSAKYTPRGGQLEVAVSRDGEHGVIRVRDNGMGIPPHDLRAVFEMFHQVDRPDKVLGGLGIGLALVRRLVEMHGGTVEARSGGVGQGTEFVVRLPLAREAHPPTTDTVARSSSGRRLRVLVVDDNADLVTMLATFVESLGHDVRKAFDGSSALSAAVSYRPDVVLLDLGLPGMTGLEVARELRRRPETSTTHIVALTGWGQADDVRQTEAAGFNAHLTKPTDPAALEQLLSDLSAKVQR